ncbi:MAG: hypothetical protein ACOH1L_09395 [Thermomonas sp.]
MHRIVPASLLLLLVAACYPHAAQAQVRRCTADDGSLVFTDRKCTDIGTTERAYSSGSTGSTGVTGRNAYRGCSRTVQDLAYELGNAIQMEDVNQLAGLYDFSGASTASGYRLMKRLELIASRPLVDVQPMYSGGHDPYNDPYAGMIEFDEDGAVIQRPAVKPRLIGLRLEQTLSNGSTPSRTVFGLRKNMGCWWVHF